jgi:hypothetical protein
VRKNLNKRKVSACAVTLASKSFLKYLSHNDLDKIANIFFKLEREHSWVTRAIMIMNI